MPLSKDLLKKWFERTRDGKSIVAALALSLIPACLGFAVVIYLYPSPVNLTSMGMTSFSYLLAAIFFWALYLLLTMIYWSEESNEDAYPSVSVPRKLSCIAAIVMTVLATICTIIFVLS
jgi:heme A synthase